MWSHPISTLFPYTTLFRSTRLVPVFDHAAHIRGELWIVLAHAHTPRFGIDRRQHHRVVGPLGIAHDPGEKRGVEHDADAVPGLERRHGFGHTLEHDEIGAEFLAGAPVVVGALDRAHRLALQVGPGLEAGALLR